MIYSTYFFPESIDWKKIPKKPLEFYNWEGVNPYRPKTYVQFAASNSFLQIKMETDETDIRATYTSLNSPCYLDSCMEVFIAPFGKENGYINIEANPLSAFLAEFGKERSGRVLLSSVTDISPEVSSKIYEGGWKTTITAPFSLIDAVFGQTFSPSSNNFYINFFKCGDNTIHPHFQSFIKMGSLKKGFHNPKLFCKVNFLDYEKSNN